MDFAFCLIILASSSALAYEMPESTQFNKWQPIPMLFTWISTQIDGKRCNLKIITPSEVYFEKETDPATCKTFQEEFERYRINGYRTLNICKTCEDNLGYSFMRQLSFYSIVDLNEGFILINNEHNCTEPYFSNISGKARYEVSLECNDKKFKRIFMGDINDPKNQAHIEASAYIVNLSDALENVRNSDNQIIAIARLKNSIGPFSVFDSMAEFRKQVTRNWDTIQIQPPSKNSKDSGYFLVDEDTNSLVESQQFADIDEDELNLFSH